jgi:heme exporter protein A
MLPDGAVLEARAINCWRGDRHILRDVSFAVRSGEFLKITGPNGVGKTTLLRVVCGLLPAESGAIEWRGRPVRGASDEFHTDMAYLGHLNSLKADLTARENLRFLAGLRQALTPADIDAALDRVGILSRGDLQTRSLSAGQKRRLALTPAMLTPPFDPDASPTSTRPPWSRTGRSTSGAVACRGRRTSGLDDDPVLRRLSSIDAARGI